MALFDSITTSLFKEQDGHFYLITGSRSRRYYSKEDYERARSAAEKMIGIFASITIISAFVGRQYGYGWMAAALGTALVWFLVFGIPILRRDTTASDVTDSIAAQLDRQELATSNAGRYFMLGLGVIFTLLTATFTLSTPQERLTGSLIFGLFGAATVFAIQSFFRARRLRNQSNGDDHQAKLSELREKGILSAEEVERMSKASQHAIAADRVKSGSPWLPLAVGGCAALLLYLVAGTKPTNDGVAAADTASSDIATSGDSQPAELMQIPIETERTTLSAPELAQIDQANAAYRELHAGDDTAADRFTAALDGLMKTGICWGKLGQPQTSFAFHRCDSQSIQSQTAPKPSSQSATSDIATFTPEEQTVIDEWYKANENCRGGSGDDPATTAACELRDGALNQKLRAASICYGTDDQASADMVMHRCGPRSLKF